MRWHGCVSSSVKAVYVAGPDQQSREERSRVEFAGPDQLDRVLVHLREARERVAERQRRKTGGGAAAVASDSLSFGTEPVAPTARESAIDNSAAAGSGQQDDARSPDAAASGSGAINGAQAAAAELGGAQRTRVPDGRAGVRKPVDPVGAGAASGGAPVRSQPGRPLATDGGAARGQASPGAGVRSAGSAADVRMSAPLPPRQAPVVRALGIPSGIGALAGKSELMRAILASSPAFKAMAWFSCVSNILMLAGPLFMLQVYDRVMTSGSMPTLLALSILTAALYGVIGILDMVRSRVMVRVGVELDRRVGERVFGAALRRSLAQPGSSLMALRELDSLRQFIAGPGPLTAFDVPWTPIYMLVIYLTHWTLGVAATLGAALLVIIAWVSETQSRQPLAEASKAAARSLELAETGQRNAESIGAMGMLGAYRARWQTANGEALAWQVLAADRLASMTSLSKSLRLLLQSMMLAIGAALAINGQISAGAIIAATIIFGRALAPVEQGVGQWRSFVKARESFGKLEELLKAHPEPALKTSLPAPKGHLEVKAVRVLAPEGRQVILASVSFAVAPGQMVAVIGPSASGKSTLARTLVGLWPTAGGEIAIDGARLEQWNSEELGRHIGYLPQNVELFAGTVRENISRFEPAATDQQVVEAARAAHAHDMIMALPQGYETQLGAFGTYLSAGQRQRIGLARALFGYPALVVLDEPNANLDRFGDEALAAAIDGMRKRGQAIVLVSHRVQAIGKADLLLYLERGQQRAFGPREEVLRFLQQGQNGGQPGGSTSAQGGKPAR